MFFWPLKQMKCDTQYLLTFSVFIRSSKMPGTIIKMIIIYLNKLMQLLNYIHKLYSIEFYMCQKSV